MAISITAHRVLVPMLKDLLSQKIITEAEHETILGLSRSRNVKALVDFLDALIPAALHVGPDRHMHLRQLKCLFSKNESYSRRRECDSAAWASFLEGEQVCADANERIDNLDGEHPLYPLIVRMQREISRILGPYERFEEVLPQTLRLSSGASASSTRAKSAIPYKVSKRLETNSFCYNLYVRLFPELRLRHERNTSCNRITFVPKNFKTSRTIACEPRHSMPLQLAFDSYCKDRLKRKASIDLSDQSLNQLGSFVGSVSRNLATVDLKAASDTLCFNAVCLLFPWDWFVYLRGIRSSFWKCELNGTVQYGAYSKFASMGNGTTFPLETLVFVAAARAIGSNTVIVYGDDIIVDDDKVSELLELLAFLGFSANVDKTFSGDTPFRESCGTDWYNGRNVTPFYMRKDVVLSKRITIREKMQLCHLVNGLTAKAVGPALYDFCAQLVSRYRLVKVPPNADTQSGVFSEDAKVVLRHGILSYRRYTEQAVPRREWRTYVYFYALCCMSRGEMPQRLAYVGDELRCYMGWGVVDPNDARTACWPERYP